MNGTPALKPSTFPPPMSSSPTLTSPARYAVSLQALWGRRAPLADRCPGNRGANRPGYRSSWAGDSCESRPVAAARAQRAFGDRLDTLRTVLSRRGGLGEGARRSRQGTGGARQRASGVVPGSTLCGERARVRKRVSTTEGEQPRPPTHHHRRATHLADAPRSKIPCRVRLGTGSWAGDRAYVPPGLPGSAGNGSVHAGVLPLFCAGGSSTYDGHCTGAIHR